MEIDLYKKILIVVLTLFGIPIVVFLRIQYLDMIDKRNNADLQIGTYVLDVTKSNIGDYKYKIDSSTIVNLRLTFFDDFTFKFNKKVQFIYDSVGRWEAKGHSIDEWTVLYYSKRSLQGNIIGNQISTCCTKDSFIYFSPTPQESYSPVKKLAFKKTSWSGALHK
ncbi:MAG: hypothetical protein R3D58_00575 [Saprospiraceae bacterium]